MMEYEYLKPWKMPKDYFGSTWEGWFEVYGRHRDSPILDNVNFDLILVDLRKTEKDMGEESTTVDVWSARHFAFGWVDTIMVHSSDEETCLKADEILEKLANYPIVNDEAYSQALEEAAVKYWDEMLLSWKIGFLSEFGYSCFMARRWYSDLPAIVREDIIETVER